jgi:hypothetical protein
MVGSLLKLRLIALQAVVIGTAGWHVTHFTPPLFINKRV